jgi:hypothetical protein
VLPVVTTLTLGHTFEIHNNSTGSLTINSSGSNLVGTLQANTTAVCTCILITGTTAASWDFDVTGFTSALPTTRGGTGLTTIGTAGQALVVNSGATALEYATAGGAAAGQVIQVLGATESTQRTTTSSSFVTGSNTLSVTITPSSASNKIAIFAHHYAYNDTNNSYYTFFRGATNLGGSNGLAFFGTASATLDGNISYCFLDSPSTTSATTYQVYFKAYPGTTAYLVGSNTKAQIIVMEIKG